ncbi:acyl-CoA dehydrogenase family protein [Ornithinimicrobium cryptoxanthini]|uniref:acyl-CoA dehydrogenase family protein n=1 Tax=Ornithinimicrobium cryptoxanthini TaxID=2934161 RepID=UPI002118DFA7|nr:acyl-CoA dehydrogenase family protein [Ornithinimicrobium cryptoxanthini]
MNSLVPPLVTETEQTRELRLGVRAFLREEIAAGAFTPWVDTWLTRWDAAFTRRLAERGWVGMTVPTEFGGHGRSFLDRFAVTEELLAVGAPVAAQWVADRQIAPSLLRFGTETQKQTFLPRIVSGEMCWGIGMSEPESGSDLASVQTRARQVDGGWVLQGRKTWTSGAHEADAFFALARTAPVDPSNRHAGLSQFAVDLHADGVTIEPIVAMNGSTHFNEVLLDEVFVPDDMVLGEIGQGWHQVTSELAFERSGPERFLSTYPLLDAALTAHRAANPGTASGLGQHIARLTALHQLSISVAGALQSGAEADTAAALVKVLGTTEEGDIADTVERMLADGGLDGSESLSAVSALADAAVLQRPGFTLRGGTNEILRGVVARGLGLR